ncbi:hypothetical protein, partial [Acinetobacter baumannii]|uniref:hypothetical protein n=1 Tax=Acinetobacter baumannii TaxID=470 RepID=UPI0013D2217D
TRADSVRNALNSAYPNGRYAGLLRKVQTTGQPDSAALQYEFIYRLFIEGRFNEARQTKLKADQQFGSSYWTPQLLFIESVSYIRERQDS